MRLNLTDHVLVRWPQPRPEDLGLIREAGISAVLCRASDAFRRACEAAGILVVSEEEVRYLDGLERAAEPGDRRWAIFRAGSLPGVVARSPEEAGASATPWIHQNVYLFRWLEVLAPNVPRLLDYGAGIQEAGQSPERALSAQELALVEAWMAGGNCVLSLGERTREALRSGDAAVRRAGLQLGRTARWLRAHRAAFGLPVVSPVVVLAEANSGCEEIVKLCFRFNVSPRVVRADDPSAAEPDRIKVLCAAGIKTPTLGVAKRILAHALAGATVVTDAAGPQAWWQQSHRVLEKEYQDRRVFRAGKGRIVAYKEPVSDPGDLALDLLDLLARDERPVRIWNARHAIVWATSGLAAGGTPGKAAEHIVNYGEPVEFSVLVRIWGSYARAVARRPDADDLDLPVWARGASSEVALPRLGRAACVVFA